MPQEFLYFKAADNAAPPPDRRNGILQALQLLGKVGGRCRKGKEVPTLVHRDNPENGLRFFLSFQPSPPFLLPMDSIVAACSRAFKSRLEGRHPPPTTPQYFAEELDRAIHAGKLVLACAYYGRVGGHQLWLCLA